MIISCGFCLRLQLFYLKYLVYDIVTTILWWKKIIRFIHAELMAHQDISSIWLCIMSILLEKLILFSFLTLHASNCAFLCNISLQYLRLLETSLRRALWSLNISKEWGKLLMLFLSLLGQRKGTLLIGQNIARYVFENC